MEPDASKQVPFPDADYASVPGAGRTGAAGAGLGADIRARACSHWCCRPAGRLFDLVFCVATRRVPARG